MKKIKHGFTLAEIIVTIGIISFIAVLTLPLINSLIPNNEQVMLKKAYYLIGRNVTELVNDDDFYPETGIEETAGLANVKETEYHGQKYGSDSAEDDKQATKFCELFAVRMNIKDDVNCSDSITLDNFKKGEKAENVHFTTADGIEWILPISIFDEDGSIYIDVNGEKGPNCFSEYAELDEVCDTGVGPDRFEIKLDKYGKLTVPDKVSKWYLKRNDTTKSYKDVIKHEMLIQKKDDPDDLE